MDIDTDNVTAGSPLVCENCDQSKVSQNSRESVERKPKRDRKRACGGDGFPENGLNKRITSGKNSDAIMLIRDETIVNASSNATQDKRVLSCKLQI